MSIKKTMTKRIVEKIYKRKMQNVFAQCLKFKTGIKVKPSRVHLRVYEEENEGDYWIVGKGYGITMKIRIIPAKEVDQDEP